MAAAHWSRNARRWTAKKRNKGAASSKTSKLDRDFRRFLDDRGLSPGELDRAEAEFSAREPKPETKNDPDLELPQQATQMLKEAYPVKDARKKADGEVWLRLDPSEAEGLSMDALSAKAAELYGDGIDPMKIVVWVDNRPRAGEHFQWSPHVLILCGAHLSLFICFFSGFSALVCEVAWTRMLVPVIGNTNLRHRHGYRYLHGRPCLGWIFGRAAGRRTDPAKVLANLFRT